jgi:threonine/homoserine/homoserine lactone efflux protein
MLESVITVSITGLVAGFIFAMPIAGPISIMIVSNALKGRRNYSNQISMGAATADFAYIFIAIYGLTKLYPFYKPAIPYILIAGSFLFILLGFKLFKTKVDFEHLEDRKHMSNRIKSNDRNGFYTGFMINILNPTQFIGGLTSSFFVISFVSSIGLKTGGLELRLNENVQEINNSDNEQIVMKDPVNFEALKKLQEKNNNRNENKVEEKEYPEYFHIIIGLCYALGISLGTLSWFYLLAYALNRYRTKINVNLLSFLIKSFGASLLLIGVYFGYIGFRSVLHL